MFLPTTNNELKALGWDYLDVVLINGDAYLDTYYNGSAIIGKYLVSKGYKVGIISQPDINSERDITRLPEPRLFWGVSSGCVDSMVANYTSLNKPRRSDDFTPGGVNDRRPDRAVIAYVNLIRKYYKHTSPIVIGGIEASLRRITHYDAWSETLRRPIIFDAKADFLSYGMGERSILELAQKLEKGENPRDIRGLCYIAKTPINEDYAVLPSFEECKSDKDKFITAFKTFYINNDPLNAQGLIQQVGDRYLIHNPPAFSLSPQELDEVYELDFERKPHPIYTGEGKIKAIETIKFSVTSHRGCCGECNFCAIAVHQGRRVVSRDGDSIIRELNEISARKDFNGIISDIGGPTANMYGMNCELMDSRGACKNKRCLFPQKCNNWNADHSKQIKMLKNALNVKGIKRIFTGSGLRYDLVMADKKRGEEYLKFLSENFISGQLKIAPEHVSEKVLQAMGKPGGAILKMFVQKFKEINAEIGKKQFLTYYFIAAHPNCTEKEQIELKRFAMKELKLSPEQVQVFTPLPSTFSALMYYTEKNPFTGEKIFVEKKFSKKREQKEIIS